MGAKRTEADDAASESALDSSGKDTINLQTLRPMEANIFLTLYGMRVELTKVSRHYSIYSDHSQTDTCPAQRTNQRSKRMTLSAGSCSEGGRFLLMFLIG